MFHFAARTRRRRPDLTPMIDVVFLLLVFFMLASQFARSAALPVAASGGQSAGELWSGPPRLIDIGPDGSLALNGNPVEPAHLAHLLAPLTRTAADPVILRPRGGSVQALVDVVELLSAAGFTRLLVVE